MHLELNQSKNQIVILSFNSFNTFNFYFSDRMNTLQCLEHRWLQEDSPLRTLSLISSTEEGNDVTDEEIDENESYNKLKNGKESKLKEIDSIETTKICTKIMNGTNISTKIVETTFINKNDNDKENILIGSLILSKKVQLNTKLAEEGNSLFPDAPTTPKVCRKGPSDSPPSVKALVKKFQLEVVPTTELIHSPSKDNKQHEEKLLLESNDDDDSYMTVSRCSVTCCLSCKPGCRHLQNSRKSIGIDQGIIC